MKKKVKRIWLMGKLRELNMYDPCLFEDEMNQELKVIAGKKDLSGMKVTVDLIKNLVKFWWPIIIKDASSEKDRIPEALAWLIMGMERPPLELYFAHFSGFNYYFNTPDIIQDYKKLARENHASRIKDMKLTHSNLRGMEMELQF